MMGRNFVIALAFVLAGCGKQSTQPVIEDSDVLLQRKITGLWVAAGSPSSRQCNADFTFVDSGFAANPFDGSGRILVSVWHGRYSISHSILQYTDVFPQFFDSLIFEMPGLVIDHSALEISVVDDTLFMKSCEVLTPVGENNGGLNGTWTWTYWRYHYQVEPYRLVYNGRVLTTLTFVEDSSLVISDQQYPDGYYPARPRMRSFYTYRPPILDYGNTGDALITVEFSGNTMIWHHDYVPGVYHRVN